MRRPAPVAVAVDVPVRREDVYAFLDEMANHERFTDHLLTDWRLYGPPRGVGARATVRAGRGPFADEIAIEVVDAVEPGTIVERNVGAGGRRVAHGTYRLRDLGDAGTRVTFEYAWFAAPVAERLLAPLVRAALRRGNARAMRRLREVLARDAGPRA